MSTFPRPNFGAYLCALAVVAVILPFVLLDANWLHSGNYATALLLLLGLLAREIYVRMYGRRKATGHFPETIALTGGAVLALSALIAALIDADTQTFAGAPGAQVPLPGLSAAARFLATQAANPQAVAVMIVPQNADPFTVRAGRGRIFGHRYLTLRADPSAAVAARTIAGEKLTITRPTGGGFLAPLLLFRTQAQIADQRLPTDVLAIPARELRVLGFYVDPLIAKSDHFAKISQGRPGVIFDLENQNGRPESHAIGFAADGTAAKIGGLALTATLGYYPTLVVTSIPFPSLVVVGIFGIVSGGATILIRRLHT